MRLPTPGALMVASSITAVSARTMWSSTPATHDWRQSDGYLLKTAYPLGNGRLGAMPFGPPGAEKLVLNVDSLWSGGPFEVANYTGGNPTEEVSSALPAIRYRIFENGVGEMEELLGSNDNYGSYRVLGNLTVDFDLDSPYTEYRRALDLKSGTHTTQFVSNGQDFETRTYCTYPDQVCVYTVSTDGKLPKISVSLTNQLIEDDTIDLSCSQGQVRLAGVTQRGPPEGMKFDAVAAISRSSRGKTTCSDAGSLVFSPEKGSRSMTLVVAAGTNFDQSKGNAENDYSFKGIDPGAQVDETISRAKSKGSDHLLRRHLADFRSLESQFSLDLPDTEGSSRKETSDAIADYLADGAGDPFVEALLFDYSRYLLICSSRPGSLPTNLQGRWSEELYPAWSADYHANINLQMNYWVADQTGLRETQQPLWDYMSLNWVPRGTETARLLYNASGWVVHNEMNIFGHTGMKSDAGWANYPAAPAWMMQHVWDYFDYTQDVSWLAETGYPLIKGVAEFWLSSLVDDTFNNDGTLVVNPCNSPEHGPTTFGCTHYQQEIHQVFEAVLTAALFVPEPDEGFLEQVAQSLTKLDKGFDYTSWGGVKEWKLPDSFGLETETRHRHLSHLTGWFPGYSISSFLGGYSDPEVQSAIKKTLIARGNGTADDANAGWAKVWRSACWSRLNSTDEAYAALRYAIDSNFVGNGFSMYSGLYEPFQIDANFGLGGAVLSMLVVDLPLSHDLKRMGDDGAIRTVVLGPAIPGAWAGGSVKGLRLRGGSVVDFSWSDDGIVTRASLRGPKPRIRLVNKEGAVLSGKP